MVPLSFSFNRLATPDPTSNTIILNGVLGNNVTVPLRIIVLRGG
jgi:hypothetical protein